MGALTGLLLLGGPLFGVGFLFCCGCGVFRTDVVVGTFAMVGYMFEPVSVPSAFRIMTRHGSPDTGSAYALRRNRVPLLLSRSSTLVGRRFNVLDISESHACILRREISIPFPAALCFHHEAGTEMVRRIEAAVRKITSAAIEKPASRRPIIVPLI
jgi:hypothetical protein